MVVRIFFGVEMQKTNGKGEKKGKETIAFKEREPEVNLSKRQGGCGLYGEGDCFLFPGLPLSLALS